MLVYYLDLALRSFKRNKALTALMIVTIGFGVAASMTTWSVFRAVSGDPIPKKSSELFVPQIDNAGPSNNGPGNEPPFLMDYADAVNLMRAHRARYQSALYAIRPTVEPSRTEQHPFHAAGHAVSSEFFPMTDAPFKYGGPWPRTDDQRRARVVVISSRLNDRLFGGGDSVGKTVDLNGGEYSVTGVLEPWNPQPRFYDLARGRSYNQHGESLFLPFNTATAVGLRNTHGAYCHGRAPAKTGFAALQRSDCSWVAFMVQLDTAAQVGSYRDFLDGYARAQQQAGRYDWPPNGRLRDLPQWMDYLQVVPSNVGISLYVALGMLLACLVNTAGLLLAKFMRRSGEIGVRRALGASRREIYAQFMVEASLIGLAGGVVGLTLTVLGVASVGWVLPTGIASLAHVNLSLLVMTVVAAIVATLVAGLYPTMRAAAVQSAWQLKSN